MAQSHGSKVVSIVCDYDRQTAEEQIFFQGWPNAGPSLFDSSGREGATHSLRN